MMSNKMVETAQKQPGGPILFLVYIHKATPRVLIGVPRFLWNFWGYFMDNAYKKTFAARVILAYLLSNDEYKYMRQGTHKNTLGRRILVAVSFAPLAIVLIAIEVAIALILGPIFLIGYPAARKLEASERIKRAKTEVISMIENALNES